jgi:IS5 family transposase
MLSLDGQAAGKLARLVSDLETTIGRSQQVIGQARTRLAGQTPDGATRLVSLHDPDARPIVKGRLGKPVEFGYKAQASDNADGVVLDYLVEVGNPADAPLLVPAVERIIQQTGRVPGAVTADRGYGEAAVDEQLHALGVEQVAIPRKGTPAPPAEPTSTPAASGGWSSGAPARRDASATSSIAMAGTAP